MARHGRDEEGKPVIKMRSTNHWVGCPAVAGPAVISCDGHGLALPATHAGIYAAATEAGIRQSVEPKSFPARTLVELSP